MLRSRARCLGSARSAAAYRAWLLEAVAPPNRMLDTSSSAKLPMTPAVIRPTAPTVASTYPSARPGRRPRAAIRRDIGMAMTAAPRIWKVPPSPAHRADPDTCSASSAPTATPADMPTPPRTWDALSVRTTCRCTRSGAGAVVVIAAVCRVAGTPPSGRVTHRRLPLAEELGGPSAAPADHRPLVVVAHPVVLEVVEGHPRQGEPAAVLALDIGHRV